MDERTVRVYDERSREISARHRSDEPTRLYGLIRDFFHPGEPTADIGCGSGRDTDWLNRHGYPAIGYDASHGMLAEARATYAGIDVRPASLPDLHAVPDASAMNVLCSAVLMHLPAESLPAAAGAFARILRPRGRLILGYRNAQGDGEREADGRLFTAIAADEFAGMLEAAGIHVRSASQEDDATRPGVVWCTVSAEKSG